MPRVEYRGVRSGMNWCAGSRNMSELSCVRTDAMGVGAI